MSSGVSQNLQSLLRPRGLEHQSKLNSSSIPANTLFQSAGSITGNSSSSKPQLSSKFMGKSLSLRSGKRAMGSGRSSAGVPRAVLTTDHTSPLLGKFNLDGNIELKVSVGAPTSGAPTRVEIQVTNGGDSLVLHWGVICDSQGKWVLPSRCPHATKVYKDRALRTPFVRSDSNSLLDIDIDDPNIRAIEFLLLDEAQNKWFKNNGANFRVELASRERLETSLPKEKLITNTSVPEELVQIQAYLRWERKGKQMYTPEQKENATNRMRQLHIRID